MDITLIKSKFERIGARAKFGTPILRNSSLPAPVSIDIRRDNRGEFFEVWLDPRQVVDLDAVDVRPEQQHLLLMAHITAFGAVPRTTLTWRQMQNGVQPELPQTEPPTKSKFLCGHDERHWFVAAIPEKAGASTVRTAMEALKPPLAQFAEVRAGVRFEDRFRRKNRGFVRQGEWFFIPRPDRIVPDRFVLRNEPISRGRGKSHWCEFAYREGGETVYVSPQFPNGLLLAAYHKYISRQRPGEAGTFRVMKRNAAVFVRGRITHPDHATVVLRMWHEVVMNTENQARAMRHVAFLD